MNHRQLSQGWGQMSRLSSRSWIVHLVPRRATGFTLVELIVTLLIISVAAIVSVPAFLGDRKASDLDRATERLEALLYLARDSALVSASPMALVLDSVSGLVWLTSAKGGGSEAALLLRDGTSLDLPTGIRMQMSSARARFLFQPSGAAFADTLFLHSAAEKRAVTVNPWTGHAIVLR